MKDDAAVAEAGTKLWHQLVEWFGNHTELDIGDFQEIAEKIGLLAVAPYNADVHVGNEFADCEEGDEVYVFTELGASMTTAWLAELSGADDE